MTPKQTKRVEEAYDITCRTSFQIAFMQAGANLASVFTGGLTHVLGDGVGIAWQVVLTNEICTLFDRQPSASAISNGLFSMLPDLLTNLALDRGIAAFVPVVGLPVCVASGLNLTWRIGAGVTALCVIPEEKQTTEALGTIAKQVIEYYPRTDFLFTLTSPSKAKFLALIARMDADHNPPTAATYTVVPPKPKAPLPAAAAENEASEETEGGEEADFEVESVEIEEAYGLVLWSGEESIAPDDDGDTPVAVIPDALQPYLNGYNSPPATPKEPKPQAGAAKRRHVATGRPKGRPKASESAGKVLS